MKRVFYRDGVVTYVARLVESAPDPFIDVTDDVVVSEGDAVVDGAVVQTPASVIRAQLADLDRTPIPPKALRELALLVDQIVFQGTGQHVNTPGMNAVRAVKAQTDALEAQLQALGG